MSRLGHWICLSLFLLVCWLAWSGYVTKQFFVIGGLFGIVLTLLASRHLNLAHREVYATRLGWRFWAYQFWLLKEIAVSTYGVVRLILGANPHYKSDFRTIQAPYPDAFRTLVLANSITLTPGTVSVMVDDKGDKLLVHALEESGLDDLETGRMSGVIARQLPGGADD